MEEWVWVDEEEEEYSLAKKLMEEEKMDEEEVEEEDIKEEEMEEEEMEEEKMDGEETNFFKKSLSINDQKY